MRRLTVVGVRHEAQLREMLREPAQSLRRGGLVAFPTETVYGLGANAMEEEAVRRIFAAKERPRDNPLIVHIARDDQLRDVIDENQPLQDDAVRLMRAFWPGPLTLLLPAGARLAPSVHPGQPLVGIRMPDHPVARALIAEAGVPVAAPSANRSGRPSPTAADDVEVDLGDRIDWLVDGGPCPIGVESTVLLLEPDCARILRPGGVTQEMIASVIDRPVLYAADAFDVVAAPLAPGMKYRHYAPDARVHVWWGEPQAIDEAMRAFLLEAAQDDDVMVPALIAPDDFVRRFGWALAEERQASLPADAYAEELARHLYRLLRAFDRAGATDVMVHGVDPAHGVGAAVMNRLHKASAGRVRWVG
ncbi:threonylcarbamoyl-AMP synthase [Alicyclobacillus mali]|uniref:Threonylcarbamoyl-AMP synthase n=1 Tax=Alicyclobacillus mali (ex Roth et al. 2021) TaxID=1123961 RepID=A0ABS0F0Y0_9BACL|nr:L-threonylcarbamoyladenylate synthase [Alicyclobacillus mali (ex Roth et al. 2021)]MBF8376949.1 threonylcarbamoyl-AMP synthase [Alicyclobacillus mali (ex Roth et al. 2021)]